FALILIMLSALVATTIIDARTFTIPLELTWVPAAAALLIHPIHAAIAGPQRFPAKECGQIWALWTPGYSRWDIVGAAIGGALGIVASTLLLHFGLIRRSFADYPEWEKSVLEKHAGASTQPPPDLTLQPQADIGGESPPQIEPELAPPAPDG